MLRQLTRRDVSYYPMIMLFLAFGLLACAILAGVVPACAPRGEWKCNQFTLAFVIALSLFVFLLIFPALAHALCHANFSCMEQRAFRKKRDVIKRRERRRRLRANVTGESFECAICNERHNWANGSTYWECSSRHAERMCHECVASWITRGNQTCPICRSTQHAIVPEDRIPLLFYWCYCCSPSEVESNVA